MAKKTKLQQQPKAKDPQVVQVIPRPNETPGRSIARSIVDPATQAAATIQRFAQSEEDVGRFIEELQDQVSAVNRGDMTRVEGILTTQALTLNELFNNLARRATNQEYLQQYEVYFRLSLKAQAQCARTLEVLAAIKNPPIVFVKQANLTTGPQQINNGVVPARESEVQPIRLSGEAHELFSNAGTPALTSRVDTPLETVGAVDRTKIRSRKG